MQYVMEGRRGRTKGGYHSQADVRLLEYLARVSMKYGVDSDKFSNSFLDAVQNQESKCGQLLVECRLREKGSMVFLITKGWEVVGQFRMSEHLLNEKKDLLKEFVYRLSSMRAFTQINNLKNYKIKDLRVGMKHLDLSAKILKVSEPIQVTTRSGSYANLTNALIADETGSINLSLLGSQMGTFTRHDVIQIKNAHVAWFRGERQLRVGKHGEISILGSKFRQY